MHALKNSTTPDLLFSSDFLFPCFFVSLCLSCFCVFVSFVVRVFRVFRGLAFRLCELACSAFKVRGCHPSVTEVPT